jgi:alpha-L-arabinofuranosidase
MTKYNLVLYSKNKESLEYFLKFLKHNLKIQRIQKPLSYVKNKRKKKRSLY